MTESDQTFLPGHPTKVWCMNCGFTYPTAEDKEKIRWTPFRNMQEYYLFCEHWTPKYWESQGFERNWGDAAVMNWPYMEVLRRQELREDPFSRGGVQCSTIVKYMILSPLNMRRPLEIYASGPHVDSWGSY